MRPINIMLFIFIASLLNTGVIAAINDLLASYEPSETNLTVTSPDIGTTTLQSVMGGLNGTPEATEGSYVMQLSWSNETDGKIEIKHQWTNYTFDLIDKDMILVDVYMASQLSPEIIGIWDDIFGWYQSPTLPPNPNEWFTLEFDISDCNKTSLDHIAALLFENMAVSYGTIYFDNLRAVSSSPATVIASGHDSRIDLRWDTVPIPRLQGYNIYRADFSCGPFNKLNSSVHTVSVYSDFLGVNNQTYYYYIKAVDDDGIESNASNIVSSTSYAMTDDQLLTSIQEATFRYFWDFGHPVSGLTRERYALYDRQAIATGGSGMGLMTIVVGAERGFITRDQAANRILKTLTFLDEDVPRFHGAWPHWFNGTTGELIPFGTQDGGDIVETSFLIQGMLTARQYFDSTNAIETEIRTRITSMWESVEWDWYLNGGETLNWIWSPTTGFDHQIYGFNECMITYLLAIASPTYPIPTSCYYNGWATGESYNNGNIYYNYRQWVGWKHGGPLFWTHYSYLGFDPRNKRDNYCNYFDNSRNISLIHQAYCMSVPQKYAGYGENCWGLTSSLDPWSYNIHEPIADRDNGTITPTAAISSIPYTPTESLAAIKHFYYNYGENGLWGPFGFFDAFNPSQDNWFASDYIAIDQGTIVPMIENSRTSLCWELFMNNPEILPMLESIGWATRSDSGLKVKYYEGSWSSLPNFDTLTPIFEDIASIPNANIRNRDDYYGLRFTGYISIEQSGVYTFYTESDDGSKLYINSSLIVNNDGLHSQQERSGSIGLTAGMHGITVDFFESEAGAILKASYQGPGITKQTIPVNVLFQCNLPGDINNDCHVDISDLSIMSAGWLTDYTFNDFAKIAENW